MKKVLKSTTAFTGKRGFGLKPTVGGGGGGGKFDHTIFKLPRGASSVDVITLEGDVAWYHVHAVKSVDEKYFGNHYILSPRDPKDPDEPSFIDNALEKYPSKYEGLVEKGRTVAVTSVWVPAGVPGRDLKSFFDVGQVKLLILTRKLLPIFEAEYLEQRKNKRDLRGVKWKVSRSLEGDMTPGIGDVWFPRGRVKLDFIEKKLGKPQEEWPIDWRKVFPECKDKAAWKALVAKLKNTGSVDVSDPNDDIPF